MSEKKKWPKITYRVELADDSTLDPEFIPPGILKQILELREKAESDG